jgi:hypothetical protein
MKDVTTLLQSIKDGDPHAAGELLPLVYHELRALARKKLARESPGQTLDATALVHEAYVRMVGGGDDRRYADGGHFFAVAAEAMRHILVDKARRKRREKHGGGRRRVELDEHEPTPSMRRSIAWRSKTRRQPASCSFAISPASQSRTPPPALVSLAPPPTVTGHSPAPGCSMTSPPTDKRPVQIGLRLDSLRRRLSIRTFFRSAADCFFAVRQSHRKRRLSL